MGGGSDIRTFLKVFVYGTLKRGEPNHHWLTKPENGIARFVGQGKTQEKYPLVIASRYNIPFLLDVPGTGNNIEGEVYEIDNNMLSNLDILEDYPTYYTRREERILSGEEEQLCWTYFLNGHKPSLLQLPMLASYSSGGDHGLVYMERYRRDPVYDFKVEVILGYKKAA